MVSPAGAGQVIGAGISAAGGIGSTLLSMSEARGNRKWQKNMSDTAYRRAVLDMKLAGLNPILAPRLGGASSPGGAMPNITNPLEGAASSARSYVEKVNRQKLDLQNLRNLQANERYTNAQAAKTAADIDILKENLVQARSNSAKALISQKAWEAAGPSAIRAIDAVASTELPPLKEVLGQLGNSAMQNMKEYARRWYGNSKTKKPLELTITPSEEAKAKHRLKQKLERYYQSP